VKSVKSPVNIEICDSKRTKVMHTNRLRHRYIADRKDCATYGTEDTVTSDNTYARGDWAPPGIEHVILPTSDSMSEPVPHYTNFIIVLGHIVYHVYGMSSVTTYECALCNINSNTVILIAVKKGASKSSRLACISATKSSDTICGQV